MRKRVALVAAALAAALAITACGPAAQVESEPTPTSESEPAPAATSEPAPTPTSEPASAATGEPAPVSTVEGTPVLFYFADDPAVAQLRADMGAGRVPVECSVLYDQMGARPEVTVTDPETISQIYERLSRMVVPEEGNALGMTDSYHHVWFTLQDGTRVGWSFEGESALVQDGGRTLLPVSDQGGLWQLVRELQDEASA